MDYQKELKKEYAAVMKKMQNPNVSEYYLDQMLEIIALELQSNANVKVRDRRSIKEAYKKIHELNNRTSIQEKALAQLYKLYLLDDDLTDEQVNILTERALKAVDLLELEPGELTDDKDFIYFLQQLMRMKHRTDKENYINIDTEDKEIDESVSEVNKRLYSYFKDTGVKTKKNSIKRPLPKTYDEIIESINQGSNDWDITSNILNNFYQALRNTHVDQSELNRIRSLINSGSDMKEAILAVIPNKTKRTKIQRLVRLWQAKAIQLDEARKRLY